jgi:DNA-binding transcriptional LysR family regulator
MNIHHLELFYYVAKHGGISEAVRNIPYGIQQPAVSGQVIQLEEFLGLTLFKRRPFALTEPGRELYAFIAPFFDNVGTMADKLRGGVSQCIRIGASEVVLRDYVPDVLRRLRGKFPRLKFALREGYQPQLESWLAKQEIDFSITLIDGKPPAGISGATLLQLPLVLYVPKASKLKSAEELWTRDRIEETLISLPTNESIHRNFQRGLAKRGVDWFPGIEVSSIQLVQTYVASGYGIGLSIAVPRAAIPPALRSIPLEGFDPVNFGVQWQGRPDVVGQAFIEVVKQVAEELMR